MDTISVAHPSRTPFQAPKISKPCKANLKVTNTLCEHKALCEDTLQEHSMRTRILRTQHTLRRLCVHSSSTAYSTVSLPAQHIIPTQHIK
jgi:hypothetical protein